MSQPPKQTPPATPTQPRKAQNQANEEITIHQEIKYVQQRCFDHQLAARFDDARQDEELLKNLKLAEFSEAQQRLQNKQQADLALFEETFAQVNAQFNEEWDNRLEAAEKQDFEEQRTLVEQQDKERQMLHDNLQVHPPLLFRNSTEYLRIRKVQCEMSKQKMFERAWAEKCRADAMDCHERQIHHQKVQAKICSLINQLEKCQATEFESLKKKQAAKINERMKNRKDKWDILLKRHNNCLRDLQKAHAHERNKKQHSYTVVRDAHDACNFFGDAEEVHAEEGANPMDLTGNTKLTWKKGHNDRLLKSLRFDSLETVNGQANRNRIVQRDPISHRAGGKQWKGHLKRSDNPGLQLAIQKKLNRSFSHQNPDHSMNMSFAGGLNETVVHDNKFVEHGSYLNDGQLRFAKKVEAAEQPKAKPAAKPEPESASKVSSTRAPASDVKTAPDSGAKAEPTEAETAAKLRREEFWKMLKPQCVPEVPKATDLAEKERMEYRNNHDLKLSKYQYRYKNSKALGPNAPAKKENPEAAAPAQ